MITTFLSLVLPTLGTVGLSAWVGDWIGKWLARRFLAGFGSVASAALTEGRVLRLLWERDPTEQARADLDAWIQQHDPNRLSPVARNLP